MSSARRLFLPATLLRPLSVFGALVAGLALSFLCGSLQAQPTVTNVQASQTLGTMEIVITYDLADATGRNSLVSIAVSRDGGVLYAPAVGASGAVGWQTESGTGKTVKWDVGAQWPGLLLPNGAKVRISAVDNLALVPAGAFPMGDALDGDSRSLPLHSVTLPAFSIAKTLTTWAEWQAVRTWAVAHGYADLAEVGAGLAPTHPAHSISWYDSVKWCNAKSEMEGLTPCYYTNEAQTDIYRTGSVPVTNGQVKWTANGYRLPTEAEWEYSARGGLGGKRFPWGDTISHTQANYSSSSSYTYDVSATRDYHPAYQGGFQPYTSPVTAFAPNNYGLYDMAGNLWQWCWDRFGNYSSAAQSSPHGPAAGSSRMFRGGAWAYGAAFARSAYRGDFSPDYRGDFGFRYARSSAPLLTATPAAQSPAFTVYTLPPVSLAVWLARPEVPVGQRTPLATPAGDGVTNLMKFALGVPPLANAAAHLPQPGLVALPGVPQALALDATFNPQAQDLHYALEVSENLVTWAEVPSFVEPLGANPDGTVLIRLRELDPPAAARRFAQLRVTMADNSALIPAGTFSMGDSFLGEGNTNELPLHSVTLPAFYMAKTLTTWAEWQTVRTWALAHGYTDLANVGAGKAATHPVLSVSWGDTVKWCNAKSEMEGLTPCYYTNVAQTTVYRTGSVAMTNAQVKWTANGYRLPTEAEWEYSARGGLSGKRFPWGDSINHTQANYNSSAAYAYDGSAKLGYHPDYAGGSTPYTSPVTAFPPNGYGLYDMAGNAMSWCWDWSGDYGSAAQTSPQGPASGETRVARGGGWFDVTFSSRPAARYYYYVPDPDYNSLGIGFRWARSSSP